MKKSDENTKLFHHFFNHRKSVNTILQLEDIEGSKVSGFKDLVAMGVNDFELVYLYTVTVNLVEIVKLSSYFPCFVTEEVN
jgi:hypothetical protein